MYNVTDCLLHAVIEVEQLTVRFNINFNPKIFSKLSRLFILGH